MREGETTEGREGSRGTVRKAAASRHPSQNPVPFPAPLILSLPPRPRLSIPSEITFLQKKESEKMVNKNGE